MQLADDDPQRAVTAARLALRRAIREHDFGAGSIAQRAIGYSLMMCGDMDAAIGQLRGAIRLGIRAQAPELAARARVIMAFAVNQRGRPQSALRELAAALDDLDDHARAKARTQRGVILWQLGRLDEALEEYRTALPVLRRVGDSRSVQRTLLNRGILYAERYAFAPAIADLQESARLCLKDGRELSLGIVEANLGWAMTLRGDVPAALEHLGRAERRIKANGGLLGPVIQDRCGLLLSVGLLVEARTAAVRAVEAYKAEHRRLRLPEARLQLAQIALLSGEPAETLSHAAKAHREFTAQRRREWAALAQVTLLRARLVTGQRCLISEDRLDDMVTTLGHAGWPAAALECRLVAARLAAARGHRERARQWLMDARSTLPGRPPAALRGRVYYADALLHQYDGDRCGAARAARRGLRVLDDHCAAIGAADVRAHLSLYRADLTELGLRGALDSGRLPAVFEWVERGKATQLRCAPLRPPTDPQQARLLSELRSVATQFDQRATAGLASRHVQLERQVRDHSRQQRGQFGDVPSPVSMRAMSACLGNRVLVEYFQFGGLLHGLSLAHGRLRLRVIGEVAAVSELVRRMRFALHRLAASYVKPASKAAAQMLLRRTASLVDTLLLEPFTSDIGDQHLVVVPTGPLHGLPWSTLPSCEGRPLAVTPSATLWHIGYERVAPSSATVAVAAGPQLPGARSEAAAVAAVHGVAPMLDESATVEATLAALRTADLVHLAAHGRLVAENPLFSSLLMTDGPLMVYDLEQLPQLPQTVVLAACDSGRSAVFTGDELLGLGAAFMARGTAQLIASVVPIPDAYAGPLMIEFHRRLVAGQAPAAALASTQQQLAGDDPNTLAAAAGFLCLGVGATAICD